MICSVFVFFFGIKVLNYYCYFDHWTYTNRTRQHVGMGVDYYYWRWVLVYSTENSIIRVAFIFNESWYTRITHSWPSSKRYHSARAIQNRSDEQYPMCRYNNVNMIITVVLFALTKYYVSYIIKDTKEITERVCGERRVSFTSRDVYVTWWFTNHTHPLFWPRK